MHASICWPPRCSTLLVQLGAAFALVSSIVGCGDSSDDATSSEAPPADGTVAGCQGSYEGTFAGDVTGAATGSVNSGGTLAVNVVIDGTGYTGSGSTSVPAAGEMTVAVGAYAVRGTFDLSTCTVSGTWAEGFDRGTWSMTRVGG